MNYFRCTVGGSGKGNTVTVTCAEEFAGLTITLSKTGKTYTKTCPSTAPYVVTFYSVENGTYTVSCTVDGQTYSETVIVQDISCVLSYGFTWQTWVDTASQLDSSDYDTLDEVLADEKALRELFLEHACVDYMAESAASNEDLETVINNDLCAKWINLSDYALDNLYANEVIADLMDEADKYGYGEWALMPQVPKMTSNTAPFGTAFASSVYGSSNLAYYAFDGVDNNTNNMWASDNNDVVGAYIGYTFTSAVKITEFVIHQFTERYATSVKVQGSNDGFVSDVNDLSSAIDISASYADKKRYSFSNNVAYTSYRLYVLANSGAVGAYDNVNIQYLQFYTWAPKGNVPVMTSNTAPYGTVTCDSITSGYDGYKGFDNNLGNSWITSKQEVSSSSPAYLGYAFTTPVKIKRASLSPLIGSGRSGGSNPVTRAKDYKIQASNDGSTWVDLYSGTFRDSTTKFTDEISINNDDYYLRYRILITSQYSLAGYAVGMSELQFYGRELKVSVPTMTSNTAPYGNVITSGYYDANTISWKAFDGNDSTFYLATLTVNNSYVGYIFTHKIKFGMAKVYTEKEGSASNTRVIIQGSNNGINWEDISEQLTFTATRTYIFNNNSNNEYQYIRLISPDKLGQGAGASYHINTLQFYGLDYSEKEFEAGTTKKWLYDHGVELEPITAKVLGGYGNADKYDSQIRVEAISGKTNSGAIARNTNAIDLTSYNLARIIVGDYLYNGNNASAGNTALAVLDANNIDKASGQTNIATGNLGTYNTGVKEASIDISSINQSLYLEVYASHGSYSPGKIASFNELWLE